MEQPSRPELKIGLALSGGGMRAAGFHLGVLGRLASNGLLESVAFISTVSGGSLGTGLVYALSGNRWPTSVEYSSVVVPAAKCLLTTVDIQRDALFRLVSRPWRLFSRGWANILSESLQRRWNVKGLLKDLAPEPRWIINATAYESGKNWRFAPHRMGDYETGYVFDPTIPVADAMAASAGYPMLIGFLVLNTEHYAWERYVRGSRSDTEPSEPKTRRAHLWDGGVYDNLGVEALFKVGEGLRDGYNFLVVSDASTPIETEQCYLPYRQARRLLAIAMDQVRSLRARIIVDHLQEHPGTGAYLLMGNTAEKVLKAAGLSREEIEHAAASCMSDTDVKAASRFSTTLRRLKGAEFDKIYRHGWEVADCTLSGYNPRLFSRIAFDDAP